ncbi:MAG: exodeoxyribonuclease I [Pseudomonadales bacterium]|jgi:exodeoxyribonuclease-1
MPPSIYWYDFETTGIDPIVDRAIQFAGVRTDLDLNVIDEPQNIFCRPGDDVIPAPEAMAVTGILMSELQQRGHSEAEFCQHIIEQFTVPQTCVAGYNSIRFDDEFTRQMLYRNFYEPYAREWQGGNSRWDVIDMFRMAYALRPEGLEWPKNEHGVPSFRLELLTEANDIGHESAHDAVSDVLATIELSKLLKSRQPKLFSYLFDLRAKKQVVQQLYPLGKSALIHVSSMYPAKRGCLSIVVPLCSHPTNTNGIICYDLSESPDALIGATSDDISRLVFTAAAELPAGDKRIPLKTIHINRCPAIAPIATLSDERARQLGLDKEQCIAHLQQLQRASGIVEKIVDAYRANQYPEVTDPDFMLYSGEFFTSSDVTTMAELHNSKPERLADFEGQFQDHRLDEMLFRYRARNYPEVLSESESAHWHEYKLSRWQGGSLVSDALSRTKNMIKEKGDKVYLSELMRYLQSIQDGIEH